jgi:phosphatidylglycerophosphate synthase
MVTFTRPAYHGRTGCRELPHRVAVRRARAWYTRRVWLAHALTLSRIPLGLALWRVWGDPAWSVALLAVGAATDAADGAVARWARRNGLGGPDIGGWLDPAIDKLFVAMVLAAIWSHTHQLAVIALIGARELVLVPLVAVYLALRVPHRPMRADVFGKVATIAQLGALCVIAVAPAHAMQAAVVAAVLGLAAAGHYVISAARERAQAGNCAAPDGLPRDTPRA